MEHFFSEFISLQSRSNSALVVSIYAVVKTSELESIVKSVEESVEAPVDASVE